LKSRLFEEQII